MPTLTPFFSPSPPQEAPADKEERQRRWGEIAETGMMFGGGRGWLAARGEGSGGWLWFDLTIFLSPTDDFQVPQLSAIKCMKSYEET